MPLSVLDLYRKILPRTNCGDCGFSTCMAFAGMVVSEGLRLEKCPYIEPTRLREAQSELERQRKEGKWTRKDLAEEALQWARQRATSMAVEDLCRRISDEQGERSFELPYFLDTVLAEKGDLRLRSGRPLTRWEKVFLYNHMAQGGSREPTGTWKGFVELPNTVSKVKTMERGVERPLSERFRGRKAELIEAAVSIGGKTIDIPGADADAALVFRALPRIPVVLLFWDEDSGGEYGAQAKLLFDETILEHLDIESILFLSERIKQMLCGEGPSS